MLNLFDLGQNRGNVTQMLIEIAESIECDYHLYGFEANTKWHNHCAKRFADNPNVTCIHAAISDQPGKVKLYACRNGVGDSIFIDKNNVSKDNFEEVDAVVFSEWFNQNISSYDVNVLKINIEGAEYLFFQDMVGSGMFKYIDIFCGTNDDVQKIASLRESLTVYYRLLEEAGIDIHYFSDYETQENVDLKVMIEGLL